MIRDLKGFKSVVRVEDISKEGLGLVFEDMPGLLSDVEECKIQSPIKGEVFLCRVDRDIHLKGKVRASIGLICHRCLEEYIQEVHADFSYVLVPSMLEKEEVAFDTEDMEISLYDGVEIQLGEIFREQILLQIPMRHLCKEDCRGICPSCGANLNKEECRCQKKSLDSPFSVLKKLLTN
ncbi:MAG: hypothetical protein GWP10_03715 [Nitrospiraceae bacterium]|nr:hypothetical protein [Nitrospiraceae bacterium]